MSTNRHPVNIGHLVMGLAFLCFTAGWALVQTDVVTGGDIRWLLPIPWLVAGAAGLVAVTVGNLRRTDRTPEHTPEYTPQSTDQPTGWVDTTLNEEN